MTGQGGDVEHDFTQRAAKYLKTLRTCLQGVSLSHAQAQVYTLQTSKEVSARGVEPREPLVAICPVHRYLVHTGLFPWKHSRTLQNLAIP